MLRDQFLRSALAATVAAVGTPNGALAQASTATPVADPDAVRDLGTPIDVTVPGGTLAGSLVVPTRAKPPVVLIVAGSGPTDRNGNAVSLGFVTDVYAQLAAALQTRGIASVRYDKRGIAASKSALTSESAITYQEYADDAAAWLAKLRADGRFSTIGLAGHSEGSLLGMLAAKKQPLDAFVSLAGAGRPLGEVLRAQLGTALASKPELAATANSIITSLEHGTRVDDVPQTLQALFRPSVQPFLIGALSVDPTKQIVGVGKRAAIVQGTADLQISVEDAKLLAKARPAAKLTIVDGMTHVLKIAPDPSPEAQKLSVYSDAKLPIAPQMTDAIAACVLG